MTFRTQLTRLSLAAALAVPAWTVGCGSNDAETPEAKLATQAAGVKPEDAKEKTELKTHNYVEEKTTKLKDADTGQVVKETTESTPVKVTEKKVEKTDVKVEVGDTKTTVAPAAGTPKP